jgi:hypothetical protein
MVSFVITSGNREVNDPLGTFLSPENELKAETPAWIRVFRLSQQNPWGVQWQHVSESCNACGAEVLFTAADRHLSVTCEYVLCLNCGDTSTTYKRPLTGRIVGCVSGNQWTPPCAAVKKLRRALFDERKWLPWLAFAPET